LFKTTLVTIKGTSKNSNFLFASSMRFTPSGLALKIVPDDFVVRAKRYCADDYMDVGKGREHKRRDARR